MSRLKELYKNEIMDAMTKKFGLLFLLANLCRCAIIETFFVYKIFTLNL